MFVDFLLLLIYSLLPGFAKIFDQQAFFLLNLPIIFFLIFKHRRNLVVKKIDLIFFILFLYVFIQSIVCFFLPHVNETALYMGIFMYFIPFIGFFYSRVLNLEVFLSFFIKIVFIHAILGILLYPAFGIGIYFESIFSKLNEGVAFGRMSSVSGSLGFANLMFVGFVIAYHAEKTKIYLIVIGICLLFSLQRSSWLATMIAILISTIVNFKSIGYKKISFFFVFILLLISVLIQLASNDDFDFLFSRFSEFGKEAAGERSEQWVGGINNFLLFPWGAGVGQVGQISARYENNPSLQIVPDGDFLRVVSEIGIMGLLFYLFLILFLIYSLTTLKANHKKKVIVVSLIFGYSIQMIGSNITEFYFTNFIYWIFIGYFFNLIRVGKIKQEDLTSNNFKNKIE